MARFFILALLLQWPRSFCPHGGWRPTPIYLVSCWLVVWLHPDQEPSWFVCRLHACHEFPTPVTNDSPATHCARSQHGLSVRDLGFWWLRNQCLRGRLYLRRNSAERVNLVGALLTFSHHQSDFLLFMPKHLYDGDGGSALATALSFYSHIVTLNAEGDSLVSDDTLEGLGTTSFLLHALFGSILRLVEPSRSTSVDPLRTSQPKAPSLDGASNNPSTTKSSRPAAVPGAQTKPATHKTGSSAPHSRKPAPSTPSQATSPPASPSPGPTKDKDTKATMAVSGSGNAGLQLGAPRVSISQAHDQAVKALQTHFAFGHAGNSESLDEDVPEPGESKLTDYLPEPGYFVAGAIAGGVSRTATAPLDRLKVYLLVNTKASTSVAVSAATHGHPLTAVKTASKPITSAVASLYKSGGLRTFFAGKWLWSVVRSTTHNTVAAAKLCFPSEQVSC